MPLPRVLARLRLLSPVPHPTNSPSHAAHLVPPGMFVRAVAGGVLAGEAGSIAVAVPLPVNPFARLLPLRDLGLAVVVVFLARRADVLGPVADTCDTLRTILTLLLQEKEIVTLRLNGKNIFPYDEYCHS